MNLADIKPARLTVPMRTLIYGEAGIGKSTFASRAPAPLFVGSEDGTSELEVCRAPLVRTWGDIEATVKALTEQSHHFETVVIDTVDWAEPLCWAEVCREAGKQSIEQMPYGKGYVRAQELWLTLLRRLDAMRERRGVGVVLIGHAVVKPFRNPEGDDFDMFVLKTHERVAGLLREWSDAVLFARLERYTSKGDNGRAKAVTTGARVIRTQSDGAFFAKNRYSLPPSLPLDWDDYYAATRAIRSDETLATIERLLGELDGVGFDTTRARATVERDRGDGAKLLTHANRLQARLVEVTKK